MTTPDVDKRYTFNGDDWDILVSIDGNEPQYIGSAATRTQAEKKASEYVIDYFETRHTPEAVARLVMATIPEGTDADASWRVSVTNPHRRTLLKMGRPVRWQRLPLSSLTTLRSKTWMKRRWSRSWLPSKISSL